MPLTLKEVIQTVESHLPLTYQEPWDKSGLQLGQPSQPIKKVLFALDFCHEVVREAKKQKADLIVAHHPLSLTDFKTLNLDTYDGWMIRECIQNKIALYAAHTSHDTSPLGLSRLFAQKLGLVDLHPIRGLKNNHLAKLVVYVPMSHVEKVSDALFKGGAGKIGKYGECSFRIEGIGTFKGDPGTNPYLGKPGKREEAQEERIEVIFPLSKMASVVRAMLKAHPYEEVAYDIFGLDYAPASIGLGTMGKLTPPIKLKPFLDRIKKTFAIDQLKVVGSTTREIKTVGFCNGSGISLLKDAINQGVDLFITGDVKYHYAVEAKRSGLCVVDVGHFHSEVASASLLKDLFQDWFGRQLKLSEYKKLKDPFDLYT